MRTRSLPAAGAALILGLAAQGAAADSPPNFDVGVTCRAAAKLGGGVDASLAYKGCMQDENVAATTLRRNWSRYAQKNRDTCLAQGLSPMPSYVEILTCIEMYDEAGALSRSQGGTGGGPAVPVIERRSPQPAGPAN
ncbi:hypothetical protein [Methylocella sp.]|uniref:hypothetical protein n=1 Tax=Methylocella sp. TaxID=1978226 RepID=UPI0037844D7D